jgi:hypothetical protein
MTPGNARRFCFHPAVMRNLSLFSNPSRDAVFHWVGFLSSCLPDCAPGCSFSLREGFLFHFPVRGVVSFLAPRARTWFLLSLREGSCHAPRVRGFRALAAPAGSLSLFHCVKGFSFAGTAMASCRLVLPRAQRLHTPPPATGVRDPHRGPSAFAYSRAAVSPMWLARPGPAGSGEIGHLRHRRIEYPPPRRNQSAPVARGADLPPTPRSRRTWTNALAKKRGRP